MIKIFGIRHHGPGSARRLRRALEAQRPDCILIELPADALPALPGAANAGLVPPVALLLYNPKDFSQVSYLPFAEFSPEWQALRYAFANGLPVRPIDLPLERIFPLAGPAGEARLFEAEEPSTEQRRMRYDPLGFLAELAGFSDSERWWELTFEQEESDVELFGAILDMMGTLRSELRREETGETLRREAHMRRMIRRARRDGFENIAVVCGAWHAPALADPDAVRDSADAGLLRGLKKVKTEVTWIPWSYDRLARQSGYAAGVVSPAWYELLFERPDEVTIRWMSRVAQLLRSEDLEASPAHAEEAVRLAEALATLRRRPLPGQEELEEAARAVFSQGDDRRMDLIRGRLIIGDRLGQVPPEMPAVPLQRDLEQSIRSARLTKEAQTTLAVEKRFDLRIDSNRQASLLLHRLAILDIPWGRLQEGSRYATGSFSEHWVLQWLPEFTIRVIEASPLGNTVHSAATRALLNKGAGQRDLAALASLVEEALRADLGEGTAPLLARMRDLAALTKDVHRLLEALPPLIRVLTYGDTRRTDTAAVAQVTAELIPRISIGLPAAALHIEDEVARELFARMLEMHHAVGLLSASGHESDWLRALRQLMARDGVHPLLKGASTRLLFDKAALPLEKARDELYLALSRANPAPQAAAWLEGFLHGSGLLLVHHPALWNLIDEWVDRLPPDQFPGLLPILRRIFSRFTPPERRKMLELAAGNGPANPAAARPERLEPERVREVLPVLRQLLNPSADF